MCENCEARPIPAIDPLMRTVKELIEWSPGFFLGNYCEGKKAFQLLKQVVGKRSFGPDEYEVSKVNPYHGDDSIVLSGKVGFIRVTLEPLFRSLDEITNDDGM